MRNPAHEQGRNIQLEHYALTNARASAFEPMIELNDFYNDGFGWICRHCDKELVDESRAGEKHSRFMTEGEAESKYPKLSNPALAKWADPAQTTLTCTRCGVTELVDIT